jgi:hypothetical protein
VSSYQSLILQWAERQDPLTGLVLFGLGIAFAMQGFRYARFFLPFAASAVAYGGVSVLTDPALGLAVAGLLGLVGVCVRPFGVMTASCATFGALAYYLAAQIGIPPGACVCTGLVGGLAGWAAPRFYPRTLPLIITALHGSALLILGVVSMAGAFLPSMARTFIDWSGSISFMTPTALLLLVVTGLSVQMNARQGDMETGTPSS